jgi:Zn-dependent M28 family amino/carboxypeptidase
VPKSIEVVVRRGDYDFINSRLFDKEPIELEFNLDHKLFTGPEGAKVPTYNVIAEIPGTTWPDQVVILSAHIDSWDGPGSQGTTDNGTGTTVMMEAARILMAAGAQPKRTIRIILWTGEEQGLLGSRAYVEKHKGTMDSVSAVFVDDGGTNYQGGLHCIPEMADLLAAATAPVNNKFFDGVTGKPLNVNIQVEEKMPQGGGSDHASFNAIGVPGFYWDEVGRAEYTYGWHTQHDKFDLAIPEYLKQSATCSAVTAYRLACADSLLPRETKKEDTKEQKTEAPATPSGGQVGS